MRSGMSLLLCCMCVPLSFEVVVRDAIVFQWSSCHFATLLHVCPRRPLSIFFFEKLVVRDSVAFHGSLCHFATLLHVCSTFCEAGLRLLYSSGGVSSMLCVVVTPLCSN